MRLPVLNTFSTLCLFYIIFVHTTYECIIFLTNGGFSNWKLLDVDGIHLIADQGGRFAIPFFFLTVGFYYGKALQRGANPFTFLILYGKKLLYIFFVWSLIYAVIPTNFIYKFIKFGMLNSIYGQLKYTYDWAMNNKLDFVLNGTKPHLWFLIACLTGLAISSFFCKHRIDRFLIPFGIGLYLIGLMGGSYSTSPIGLSLPLNTLNVKPLFSTIFIAVGRWFSMYHKKNKILALSLFFGGAVMHFAEIFFLKKMYNFEALGHEFLIGTAFWGIGAFLLCLEYPDTGRNSIFERIGMLTLGIYVSHVVIIYALMPIGALAPSLVGVIFISVFVLFLSYGFCKWSIRNRIFARLIT
jgi:hypothetical protein